MRGRRFFVLLSYISAFILFLFLLHFLFGSWKRILDSRILTGTRIRQLNAVADNLSRILMATETESAMLNRDVNRFLKIVEKKVMELKAEQDPSSLK